MNPVKALTEPAKQASLASAVAIAMACLALGIALAVAMKVGKTLQAKPEDGTAGVLAKVN